MVVPDPTTGLGDNRPYDTSKNGICPVCGKPGPHFAPPSLGEPGFFICQAKKATKAPSKDEVQELQTRIAKLKSALDCIVLSSDHGVAVDIAQQALKENGA